MPVDLPNDVWFYIVKNCIDVKEGKSDLANLASTDKRIREVAVPTLYEQLVFTYQSYPEDPHYPSRIDMIRRGYHRVQSLRNCPHLLNHVRSFGIDYWSDVIGIERILTESWSTLYDIVANLVLEIPHLKTLQIFDSPITLRLHSIFHRIITLEKLDLNSCTVPDERMAAGLIESYPLTIKELHYKPASTMQDPYFRRLLESCLPSLTTLNLSGIDISLISEVARNRRLPLKLQTLDMSWFFPIGDEEDPQEVCAFLMACPDLRIIRITGNGAHMDMGGLQGSLVNLESVSASIKVVRQLASGRPVRRVEFLGAVYEANPADFETPWSSSVPIRRVHLERCLVDCPFEKAVIKSMACALPHVTHITIDTTSIIMDSAELNEMMVACIAQLTELIYCRLYSKSITEPDSSITEELAECPIAPRGNPNERGHPSLEEVRLCSRFTWIWIPGNGWVPEIRKWNYEYEYTLAWSWDPVH